MSKTVFSVFYLTECISGLPDSPDREGYEKIAKRNDDTEGRKVKRADVAEAWVEAG